MLNRINAKVMIETGSVNIPVANTTSPMRIYYAVPDSPGPHPGVIVGTEIFGINDHFTDIAGRLAASGYVAVVPDFYHRTAPGASIPYTAEGRKEGLRLTGLLTRDEVCLDVEAAMHFLDSGPAKGRKIGFLGFSSGAHIGYVAASRLPLAAAALFYGGWLTDGTIRLGRPEPTVTLSEEIARQRGAVLFIVGGEDHLVTAREVDAVRTSLERGAVPHEVMVYPGVGHGFFCDARPDSFHAEASRDAANKVQGFFWQRLEVPGDTAEERFPQMENHRFDPLVRSENT